MALTGSWTVTWIYLATLYSSSNWHMPYVAFCSSLRLQFEWMMEWIFRFHVFRRLYVNNNINLHFDTLLRRSCIPSSFWLIPEQDQVNEVLLFEEEVCVWIASVTMSDKERVWNVSVYSEWKAVWRKENVWIKLWKW